VHTLVTETGLIIHMMVEKKYPLRKKVLIQMLKLKLESEEDSTMVLGIIDLMRQKNKRMKQEGLNRQIGILQKIEFAYKLMIGKLQDVT
ncbi:hypothetical protein Tco_0419865, partial [Tanacetum coccineum]